MATYAYVIATAAGKEQIGSLRAPPMDKVVAYPKIARYIISRKNDGRALGKFVYY